MRREWTQEENQQVFNTCHEAFSQGFEMKVIYRELADQYNVSPGAIYQRYKMVRDKLQDELQSKPVDPNDNLDLEDDDFEAILVKFENVVKDRDHYRSLAEQYEVLYTKMSGNFKKLAAMIGDIE